MKRFLAAIRFLTVLRVPGAWGTAEADLAGSPIFFPVVGLLLGVLAAALAMALAVCLPALAASALLVIALLAFSGGLHMDGLSDTSDGFLSSRPRERVLEIMRDSHVGAMGVMAIACVLMLKFSLLASLPPGRVWRAALLMPLAGRVALVLNLALLPYARPQGGLAAIFFRRRPVAAALFGVVLLAGAGWYVAAWQGLAAAAAAIVVALLFGLYSYRRIGGVTGDTLGAACELAEIAPALILAGAPQIVAMVTTATTA